MEPLVAPPTASAAPTLPSLPVELVRRIIKLALPRVCFTTFKERYDILLPLCLVNNTWGALAEQELYRHLGFGSREASRMLMARSTTPSGRKQLDGVHSLWDYRSLFGMEALPACPRLKTYCFVAATLSETEINIEQIAALAPNLEELLLDFCMITPWDLDTTLAFPNLRRLIFTWPDDLSCEIGAILTLIEAPKLHTLSITAAQYDDAEELTALEQGLRRLAPQLRTFSLATCQGPQMPAAVWKRFTSLDTLAIDPDTLLGPILAALPSPINTLRILSPPSPSLGVDMLLDALQHAPAAILASLQHLEIPPFDKLLEGHVPEGQEATRPQLLRLCASNAISVTIGANPNDRSTAEYITDLMDLW